MVLSKGSLVLKLDSLGTTAGAGPGRFPLALAAQLPAYNILGLDIRGKV